MISGFQISTSLESLTDLSTLGVPAPRSSYIDGAELKSLGDFSAIWVGFPSIIWGWSFLSRSQRNALREICPGASQPVYLRSRVNDNDDEFRVFSATMIWPIESKDFTRRIEFSLQFVGVVEIEEVDSYDPSS